MTVESATASATYTGNGSTTVFTVPFYFLVDTDLKVTRLSATTGLVTTLVLNSDYTLTGAGNSAGGSLTTTPALPIGDEIYIERNVIAVQETAYPSNSPFPSSSHERALDRLTMLIQQALNKLTFGLFRDPLASTYDLGGNKLVNTADAVDPQDVPSLVQTQTLVAGAASGVLPGLIATYPDLASTAAGKGAALIGYKAPGSAVATTVDAQLSGLAIISVKDPRFGAKGDGVTNDHAAIAAALTYAGTISGGCAVYFPGGNYLTDTGFTIPNNVMVAGEGKFTVTVTATAAGITIFSQVNAVNTLSNCGVRGMTLATAQTGVVGVRYVLCSRTVISDMLFLGMTRNLEIDRGGHHTVSNLVFSTNGASTCGSTRIWSSSDTDYVYGAVLTNIHYENTGPGQNTSVDTAALYIRRAVSLLADHIYAYDLGNNGPQQNFIILENDCQGCKISNVEASAPLQGILLQQGTGVAVSPSFTTIVSADIDQHYTNAIHIGQATNTTIIGGMFTSGAVAGLNHNTVLLDAGAQYTTIIGVTAAGQSGSPSGAGFYFNGCSYVTVTGCIVDTCYNALVFAGATHVRVFDNQLHGCTNATSGTVSGTNSNYLARNDNLNPFTVTTPAFPTTGTTVQNTTGVRVTVYLGGGTITSIAVNGQFIPTAVTSGSFDLEVGETIVIGYTGTPTWKWIGH